MSYRRIPVTPDSAPNSIALDDLIATLRNRHAAGRIVFNCQMGGLSVFVKFVQLSMLTCLLQIGQGRSTVFMILSCLFLLWEKLGADHQDKVRLSRVQDAKAHLTKEREKRVQHTKSISLSRFRTFLNRADSEIHLPQQPATAEGEYKVPSPLISLSHFNI